jgi:hypothetical protein
VAVVDFEGAHVRWIKTDGVAPTNVAFGFASKRRLDVTE